MYFYFNTQTIQASGLSISGLSKMKRSRNPSLESGNYLEKTILFPESGKKKQTKGIEMFHLFQRCIFPF